MINSTDRKFTIALLLLISVLLLSGCTASDNKEENEWTSYDVINPDEPLTVWTMTANPNDINGLPGIREMERRTGIRVKYIGIEPEKVAEEFSLILARGEFPDIMYMALTGGYPGGMERAIEDGVFMDTTDLVKQYMPNYCSLIESKEEIRKGVCTDNGRIMIYSISGDDRGPKTEEEWIGLALRKDWLDEQGMDLPVTIEDWHTVLCTFRDCYEAEAPLLLKKNGCFFGGAFVTAYGIQAGYYVEDGQVKYGPAQPGYRLYLEQMADWYAEGLIDANFVTNGEQLLIPEALLVNGVVGAGEVMWNYTKDYYNGVYLEAVPNPVLERGDTAYGEKIPDGMVNNPVGISATCKSPELAAKWLDYQYSREGMELNFYGIEDESYQIQSDGSYQLTDIVLQAPEGADAALMKYARGNGIGGWYNWSIYDKVSVQRKSMIESKSVWSSNSFSRCLPYVIDCEGSADNESYRIMNALDALVVEKTQKYIMGLEGFETYDSFQALMQDYGLDRALDWYQEQYENYLMR